MKTHANETLIARLSDWQACALAVPSFAGFMTLAAWFFYGQVTNRFHLQANGESCIAPDLDVGSRRGATIARHRGARAIDSKSTLNPRNTRVPLAAHGRVAPPPPALFNA